MLLNNFKLGRKSRRYVFQFVLIAFLILNILSHIGAYAFTNYKTSENFGLGLTRPTSTKVPSEIGLKYTTERIPIGQNEWLETWLVPAKNSASRGTVVLFPGNGGSKAKQLLAPTEIFHNLGYNTLLVDFRGVGGSSGNTTTIGMREAKDVASSVNYARSSKLKRPLILYGVSMGSAAILKAIANENVKPDAIILELPFARLLDTVKSRLKAINVPAFPMAELLVFWGSIQHRNNGFAHNPIEYASSVTTPTLLLHGKLDKWTSVAEINQIFQNLRGPKKEVIFPNAGHDLLVTADKKYWKQNVEDFLKGIQLNPKESST